LRQELSDAGAYNPMVIVFGGDVFAILSRNLGNSLEILKVMYYSHYISKEKYKEAFDMMSACHGPCKKPSFHGRLDIDDRSVRRGDDA
jgi:hypothetical protein